ncbi:nucleic acid/nucleotide deaminase domain-containing protein [Streptomyces sp. NPDC048248]|uniref:nucleic acid/nucleotide deaminase domain-containing protein n=1 Tax=Streptomyces sp. NPDC048248 TaxID=3365523 RepID=UPI003710AEC2
MFSRQSLSDALPGFGQLERGEQMAVVSSLARLSLGVHEQHSVGRNPLAVTHPYRAEGEQPAAAGTRDSNAKNAERSLGAKGHEKYGKNYLESLLKEGDTRAASAGAQKHMPDFTGKNFAVLEVSGPDGITYVIDSSVPSGDPKVSPRHSERHLLDWLDRANGKTGDDEGKDGKEPRYKPLGLYTEREPCGEGEGHARCANELARLGENVPVYYSTTYRTDEFGLDLRDSVRAERKEVVAQVPGLTRQQAEEEIVRRLQDRFGENTTRAAGELAKLAKKDEAAVKSALVEIIEKEYKARVEQTRSRKEAAMAAEFNRHVSFLEGVWKGDLLSQLS